MPSRTCNSCGASKPESEFYDEASYTSFVCRACRLVRRNMRLDREAYFKRICASLRSNRVRQGVNWSITYEDLIRCYEQQDGLCALSGVLMTTHRDGGGKRDTNASIDRISPALSYVPNNVQLVCSIVNRMKGTLAEAEFWFWCENISRTARRKNES